MIKNKVFNYSLAVVLGTVILLSETTLAAGGIGGRPAYPDATNERTQSIFIMTLEPGEAKKDGVRVINSTDKEQAIELYAVDGMLTDTGSYTCRQKGDPIVDAASWIKLDSNRLTLAPNSNQVIDFTVTAPTRGADVGEHSACIVFQTPDDEDVSTTGSISLKTRQAIRAAITIPGELKREVKITSFAYKIDDNPNNQNGKMPVYEIGLNNTGNVSADTDIKLSVKSLIFGREIFQDGGIFPVIAGNDLRLNFKQTKRPLFGGWYKAQVSASYDKDPTRFGIRESQVVVLRSQELTIFIMPSAVGVLIIIGALLILFAVLAWLILKRRQQRQARRNSQVYEVQTGDTLQQVAKRYHLSWQKIVKLNNLKPPYELKVGQTIFLPIKNKKNRRA